MERYTEAIDKVLLEASFLMVSLVRELIRINAIFYGT